MIGIKDTDRIPWDPIGPKYVLRDGKLMATTEWKDIEIGDRFS